MAPEGDEGVLVQLSVLEAEDLAAVTVPRDVRAFLNDFFADAAGYEDPQWTLHLDVCVVDAMQEQLGVLRCLLAERAGRPRCLPREGARDQCAAGCVPLCRALSAAQWEAAMDVIRSAGCDPDLLPARLHGVADSTVTEDVMVTDPAGSLDSFAGVSVAGGARAVPAETARDDVPSGCVWDFVRSVPPG